MKVLLSGNEAIARGFYEAGGKFAAAYPGTPSTEILENMGQYEEIESQWSPNEKVALEIVAGAGLGGIRSLAAMKHVGLNVAADPLFSLSYQGVNAGVVVISADDPSMHSSQNEQDNRWLAKASKIPMLEPSDSCEAKEFVGHALSISEQFDTPVLIRMTTRINHSYSIVELKERKEVSQKPYERKVQKNVLVPVNAKKRRVVVEQRLQETEDYSNTTPLNFIEWGDKNLGIITSGVSYQYAREVFPKASILKLGFTFPLPKKKIKEFANAVQSLYIIEELDPFLEEQIAALGISCVGKEKIPRIGELNPEIIAQAFGVGKKSNTPTLPKELTLPPRPPVLCPGCSHRGIYYVFKKLKLTVPGDIGCYSLGALPPLESMETLLCMGAGFSYAYGMEKALSATHKGKIIGVLGDSTFFHSGIPPLLDIVYNQGKTKLCVLDNNITAMTGHQEHPGTGHSIHGKPSPKIDIEGLCKAIGINRVIVVDPYNIEETTEAIKKEMALDEPSVIIARGPCIIRERIKFNAPYVVDTKACIKCGMCHRVGCPAIEKDEDGKSHINPLLCIGCDVCRQVCKPGAIQKPNKKQ